MGCLIIEICYFQPPRKAMPSEIGVIFKYLTITKIKSIYSKQLNDIINLVIEINPDKTLSSEEIFQLVTKEYIKTFVKLQV